MGQLDAITKTMSIGPGQPSTPCIVLDHETGIFAVSVTEFENMFGAGPYTYAGLSATPQAMQGWQPYFDQWKASGYIS